MSLAQSNPGARVEREAGGFLSFVGAMFRNKRLVLSTMAAVLLVFAVYAAIAKSEYGSSMMILVQNSRQAPRVGAEEGSPSGGMLNSDMMESQVNSQVTLLQSEDLMEGLATFRDRSRGVQPPAPGSLRLSQEVQAVQHSLEVVPIRKTDLITVNFVDSDPARAQASLRWLSAAYLEKQAKLSRPAGTYQFFAAQTDQYEAQLQKAQADLLAFDASKGVTGLDQEKSLDLQRFSDMRGQVDEAQAGLRSDRARLEDLHREAQVVAPRIQTQVKADTNRANTEQLDTLLAQLQNRRIELLNRFQPTDVTVQEIDTEIASTKATLSRLESKQGSETTEDTNPVRMQVDEGLQRVSTDVRADEAKLGTLTQASQAMANRLQELQSISVQHDTLARQVDELRQNRTRFAQKRDDARIEDDLDQSKIVDVAIAEQPTYSVQPLRPRRKTTLAIGAVLACFLSLGLVFFKEIGRETMYEPLELEAVSSCPVLTTIPDMTLAPPSNVLFTQMEPVHRLGTSTPAMRRTL